MQCTQETANLLAVKVGGPNKLLAWKHKFRMSKGKHSLKPKMSDLILLSTLNLTANSFVAALSAIMHSTSFESPQQGILVDLLTKSIEVSLMYAF